ncbi:SGNH/GDSL hydrolase family protein [Alphaproteobacteria bacterium]|nr:SGNH/GDSL hydrolase family protein [Alphaproteobacteria bacterium]
MNWINNKFILLLIVLLSSLIGLIFLEIVLQIYHKNDRWADIRTKANVIRNFQFDYLINGLYESKNNSVKYIRNQYGLRDTCEDPKNIKVLTVGGSTTDQRYINLGSTFQKVLQDGLKNFWEPKSCVSNAGVDGHSTFGHLYSFENWFPLIPDLKPKYVLLYIGINDTNLLRNNPNLGFDVNDLSSFKGILKQSYIIRILYPAYKKFRYGSENASMPYLGHFPDNYKNKDYTVSKLNPLTKKLSKKNVDYFRVRLLKLINKINELGAKPICVTQPHLFSKIINNKKYGIKDIMGKGFSGIDFDYSLNDLNKAMSEICRPYFINIYAKKFEGNFFYDGIHTTPLGSKFIGKVLVDYFIKNKLF